MITSSICYSFSASPRRSLERDRRRSAPEVRANRNANQGTIATTRTGKQVSRTIPIENAKRTVELVFVNRGKARSLLDLLYD